MTNPLDEFINKNQKAKAADADASPASVEKEAKKAAIIKKIILADLIFIPAIIGAIFLIDMSDDKVATPAQETEVIAPKEVVLTLPSIEQAYVQTRVQRVKFDSTRSYLPYDEKMYFEQLFRITDKLVVERVYNYSAIYYKKPLRSLVSYEQALDELKNMSVPESATKIHALILDAITSQMEYFKFLKDTNGDWNAHNPLVQNTHSKLIAAWQEMLKEYDDERGENKLAFEKHLCALDFI